MRVMADGVERRGHDRGARGVGDRVAEQTRIHSVLPAVGPREPPPRAAPTRAMPARLRPRAPRKFAIAPLACPECTIRPAGDSRDVFPRDAS